MYRLANPFAWAHTPSRRRDRFEARPVKISPAHDPARLPSKGPFLQRMSCDTHRVRRWTWSPIARACSTPVVLPPPGLALRPFTVTIPVLLFANTVVSVRPPFTSANLFDADASLSQTQPFDFCNEFSTTTHEHTTASAALAQRRGLPYDRCHARLRSSRCLHHPLFDAKMAWARCAAASCANSPTPGLETRTPKAREPSPPRATPFRWTRRTWETRRPKERSKGKPDFPRGKNGPREACASRSLLDCSFEPLLSLAMRARRDGGPFACLYTSASPAEAFVPIVLPRRITPFRKPRGFSPWESNDGRDHSLRHSTGPLRYATVIPVLQ